MLTSRRCTAAAVATLAILLGGCSIPSSPESQAVDPNQSMRQAQALTIEGGAAEKAGDSDRALTLYRQAVEANREYHPAWNNLGALLLEKGRMYEAVAALQTAADLAPGDPRPMASLGMLWQRLEYPDTALDFYAKALERDPNHLPALRWSVFLEVLQDKITDQTAERVRKALLIERDPRWIEELKSRKFQIDQRLTSISLPTAH